MSSVFISYRREDTAAYAGRLRDHLRRQFGESRVFMDIDTIELGSRFDKVIEDAVGSCDVLIAVIGPQWLTVVEDDGRRRIESPEDFIRLEVASALERDIPVIPMLVGGARMPSSDDLPDVLKSLSRRNALTVTDERWDYDIGRLVEATTRIIGSRELPQPGRRAQRGETHRKRWWAVGAGAAVVALMAAWQLGVGGGGADTAALTRVSADRLDFGPVTTGSASETQPAVLVNRGDSVVSVSTVALVGDDGDFAIQSDGCSGVSILPDSSCAILTRFRPSTTGLRSASLVLSGANDKTLGEIDLVGTGATAEPEPQPGGGTTPAMETVTLPSLSGRTEAAARRQLDALCQPAPCLDVSTAQASSDRVPAGQVIGTRPGDSTRLNRGDHVLLVVSSGPAVTANRNDISNFRPVMQSTQEVAFMFDYTYIGDFGTNEPSLRLIVRQRDGTPIPGMVYRYGRATPGQRSARLYAYADFGAGTYTSDSVRICLADTSRRTRGYCESFPFAQTWTGAHPPIKRGSSISNFRALDPSRSRLTVTVDYEYDGTRGLGSREVYMYAVARRADGSQVPRTHWEALGGPGEVRVGGGTTVMMIEKYATGPETSVDVKVCITSRNPRGDVVCEIFPYRKVWN